MTYEKRIDELLQALRSFFGQKSETFAKALREVTRSLNRGQKILVFGNGGSASQAQHFAAELVNKFLLRRPAIPAIALTTDTSVLTSIANDESFDEVFSRQVEALGQKGDIALGLTTSGNSPNILRAIETADSLDIITIAFTGGTGGKLAQLAQYVFSVPSKETPRIQEVHITLGHAICRLVEEAMFE